MYVGIRKKGIVINKVIKNNKSYKDRKYTGSLIMYHYYFIVMSVNFFNADKQMTAAGR